MNQKLHEWLSHELPSLAGRRNHVEHTVEREQQGCLQYNY